MENSIYPDPVLTWHSLFYKIAFFKVSNLARSILCNIYYFVPLFWVKFVSGVVSLLPIFLQKDTVVVTFASFVIDAKLFQEKAFVYLPMNISLEGNKTNMVMCPSRETGKNLNRFCRIRLLFYSKKTYVGWRERLEEGKVVLLIFTITVLSHPLLFNSVMWWFLLSSSLLIWMFC